MAASAGPAQEPPRRLIGEPLEKRSRALCRHRLYNLHCPRIAGNTGAMPGSSYPLLHVGCVLVSIAGRQQPHHTPEIRQAQA